MPDNIRKLVGCQIARYRRERGVTQAQLAELVNVSPETVSRLERGVSMPSLQTLDSIGRALQVSLKDFFDLEHPKKTKGDEVDTEIARVITILKSRRPDEIRLGYCILKDIFAAVKKFT